MTPFARLSRVSHQIPAAIWQSRKALSSAQKITCSCLVLFLIICVPLSASFNMNFATAKFNRQTSIPGRSENNVFIAINITRIDPYSYTSTAQFYATPHGNLSDPAPGRQGRFQSDIDIIFGPSRFMISRFIAEPWGTQTLQLLQGDPNMYPFDTYTTRVIISAEQPG